MCEAPIDSQQTPHRPVVGDNIVIVSAALTVISVGFLVINSVDFLVTIEAVIVTTGESTLNFIL